MQDLKIKVIYHESFDVRAITESNMRDLLCKYAEKFEKTPEDIDTVEFLKDYPGNTEFKRTFNLIFKDGSCVRGTITLHRRH